MLNLNPQKETNRIIKFIRNTVNKQGCNKVVIALSGGIDSTVALYLTVQSLGKDNIYIMISPYGNFDQKGHKNIDLIISKLDIPQKNILRIDIKKFADPIFCLDPKADLIRKGNLMARLRMLLLYDYAKKVNSLVIGTENRSEYLLGYFTRFGDEASDLEPIRHLYKTQVKVLADYLGISKQIINALPTAGLWHGQTDEQELGFSYEQCDSILQLYINKKFTKQNIIGRGFKRKLVNCVIDRIKKNNFKQQTPYHLKTPD